MKSQNITDIVSFLLVTGFFIILFMAFVKLEEGRQLKEENIQLKNQITTLTNVTYELEYFCDWSMIGETLLAHYEFTNYTKYLEQRNFLTNTLTSCKEVDL